MKVIDKDLSATASAAFDCWLDGINEAFAAGAASNFAQVFAPDGHWRDLLSFRWAFRTFTGPEEIKRAFDEHFSTTRR